MATKMTKTTKAKPLKGPGTLPTTSALIGGVSNKTTVPSARKGKGR